MKFFATAAALISVIPGILGLAINTPTNVVECEPIQFNWNGGQSPYYLSLIPAGQPAAPPLKTFPTQSGTSYTWNVDLQSGTSVTAEIKDSTGAINYSDMFTIMAGSSTSCANTTVNEGGGSGSSSGGSSSSSGGSSSSSGSSSSGSSGSSSSGSPSASNTASGASPSTTHTGGAGRVTISAAMGVAGVMGLIGAALL